MLAASGEQFQITGGGYRAVVTECGAGLRVLEYDGVPVVDGYPPHQAAAAGRGQLLLPWPNRIQDGCYTFAGVTHRVAVNEPDRHNAIHGLTRWAAWRPQEHTEHAVVLGYRLMSQPGYPWTVDLSARYELAATGLTVTVTARNQSGEPAPYAHGAHPYLTVGAGPVDDWDLTVPAATRLCTDARMLPTGTEPVGSDHDFRDGRPIGTLALDDAFTDLARDAHGRAEVRLSDPASTRGVTMWMDQAHRWVQLFTGDPLGDRARTSLAVEPMTAPANALRTGTDLTVLGPAGTREDTHSASWGLRGG